MQGLSSLSTPKRFVFTGDFLRSNAAGTRPTQHHNIRWLKNLVSYQIGAATGLEQNTICWNAPPHVTDGALNSADVRRIYGAFSLPVNIESWAMIHNIETSPPRVSSFIQELFRDSFVIAFEMSPAVERILTAGGIPWVNVTIHPVRFLDDLLLGLKSNVPEVQQAIAKYKIPEGFVQLGAGVQKATAARSFDAHARPNSALFLMQTWYDQSQIKNGRFVGPLDFMDDITAFAGQFSEFLVKEHPLEKHPAVPIMAALIPNMRIVTGNAYSFMSIPEISTVATLSSGTATEARYFSKDARFFYKPSVELYRQEGDNPAAYVGVMDEFLSTDFWRDVLSPLIEVSPKDGYSMPFKPNRLRTSLRSFWNFNEIDTDVAVRAAKVA